MRAGTEERCPLATLAGLTGGRTLVRSSGSGPGPSFGVPFVSSYVSSSLHYSPETSIYVVLPMYVEGLSSDVWGISFPESEIINQLI